MGREDKAGKRKRKRDEKAKTTWKKHKSRDRSPKHPPKIMHPLQMPLVIIRPILKFLPTLGTLNHLQCRVGRTTRLPMPQGFGGLVLASAEDDGRGAFGVDGRRWRWRWFDHPEVGHVFGRDERFGGTDWAGGRGDLRGK